MENGEQRDEHAHRQENVHERRNRVCVPVENIVDASVVLGRCVVPRDIEDEVQQPVDLRDDHVS